MSHHVFLFREHHIHYSKDGTKEFTWEISRKQSLYAMNIWKDEICERPQYRRVTSSLFGFLGIASNEQRVSSVKYHFPLLNDKTDPIKQR